MFQYLKDFKFKDFRLRMAFKNNHRDRTFLNLEHMKEVVILFTYTDLMQVILIADHLEHQGKIVHLWTSLKNDIPFDEKKTSIKKTRVVKPQEISAFSILKSSVKEEFNQLKYDTLIDLTTQHCLTSEYLLALNKAKFCIGNREHAFKAFDFAILTERNKDIIDTYNQILFYLNKITS